jgi:tetratricopeptide (TPR) repeat protein
MTKQLLLILITIFSNIRSQTLDSLLIVADGFGSDTTRATFFYDKAYTTRLTNSAFSYSCAGYCEAYANRSKYPYYQAKAANILGILFYRKKNYNKAISYHQSALNWRRMAKDSLGVAKSLINLANTNSDIKKYREAELYYLQALQISAFLAEENLSRKILLNLGVLHQEKGNDLKLAEYYYLQALEKAQVSSDYEIQAAVSNNLADLAILQKQTEKAEIYAQAALDLKDMMDLVPERTDSYLNLAKLYLNTNNTAKAITYLDSAQHLIERYDYEEAKEEFIALKAQYAEKNQQFENANFYNKLLLKMRDSIAKANTIVTFDESFIVTLPEQKGSYGYFIWICLFLTAPLLLFFLRPKYNE